MSNIATGDENQVEQIIEAGLLPVIVQLLTKVGGMSVMLLHDLLRPALTILGQSFYSKRRSMGDFTLGS